MYLPIPSNYSSLIGRIARFFTKIKYGIDYIDPWVHKFPGSERKYSKHWFSMKAADFLEPIAVKRASLITGVADGYYCDVIKRNPNLKKTCKFAAMPYGAEEADNKKVRDLELKPYLFDKNEGKFILTYAGAMLPKAYQPIRQVFKALKELKSLNKILQINFIGTGKSPDDIHGFNIKPLAEEFEVMGKKCFRIPSTNTVS